MKKSEILVNECFLQKIHPQTEDTAFPRLKTANAYAFLPSDHPEHCSSLFLNQFSSYLQQQKRHTARQPLPRCFRNGWIVRLFQLPIFIHFNDFLKKADNGK